jgi:hypothetical protein
VQEFRISLQRTSLPQNLHTQGSAGHQRTVRGTTSVLRLDELQSVVTPHLDPRQFALGDEATEILKFQFLWTGFGPSKYTELRS